MDGDTVIIESGPNICWNLSQDSTELAALIIRQTYTGKIGLKRTEFATSADGDTRSTAKAEYREDYLTIDATTVSIGEHFGPGSPTGSGRIKLDVGSYASTVTIHNTARTPTETGMEAVRLLANNASTSIYVRQAPGGVGLAVDQPDETSTVSLISVGEASTDTRVHAGRGVTVTTWDQRGGANVLEAAAGVTAATCPLGGHAGDGGDVRPELPFVLLFDFVEEVYVGLRMEKGRNIFLKIVLQNLEDVGSVLGTSSR